MARAPFGPGWGAWLGGAILSLFFGLPKWPDQGPLFHGLFFTRGLKGSFWPMLGMGYTPLFECRSGLGEVLEDLSPILAVLAVLVVMV